MKTCVNIKRYIGTQIARWMIPKVRWRAKLNKMHITPAVRRKVLIKLERRRISLRRIRSVE